MFQDVYIIGATGRVGSELVKQIFDRNDVDTAKHTNPTRIVGLASSSNTLYNSQGISRDRALAFTMKDFTGTKEYSLLGELLDIVGSNHILPESSLVFVDVTSVNEPMTDFHLEVIKKTKYSVVTANKNPVALSNYPIFQRLTKDTKRYGYRASVMAGAEAVSFVQDQRDLNDTLISIQGCFSGTLGYIASVLEQGTKFSKALGTAYKEKWTETDPRNDLSGVDVARKLVVLARTLGYSVEMHNVLVGPFIDYSSINENDPESFVNSTAILDNDMGQRMALAKQHNATLRYVASVKTDGNKLIMEVSLKEVPMGSPLGRLQGTENKIVIVTDDYPKGYEVTAPGAGTIVTARNLRRDLLHLLGERKVVF